MNLTKSPLSTQFIHERQAVHSANEAPVSGFAFWVLEVRGSLCSAGVDCIQGGLFVQVHLGVTGVTFSSGPYLFLLFRVCVRILQV